MQEEEVDQDILVILKQVMFLQVEMVVEDQVDQEQELQEL